MSLPELYSALADPTRLKVLELLHEKARPVHELAAVFEISRPAISRHLRVLKEIGLVRELKQGRENVYSFERGPLKAGTNWLEKHQSAKARKARKPKPAATAGVPVEVPIVVVVPTVAAKPKGVAKPKATVKPKEAKPILAPVAPPPSQAPQLSFFDL